MKIDIRDMKSIIDKVLEKLIANNGKIIEINEDYYWCVKTDDSVDFSKIPDELGVGSLVDDYVSLEKIIKEDRDVNILDLDRIAHIIELVSLEIERSSDKHMF